MSWTENKWLKPAWMGENNDFVNKYQDKFAKIGEKFAPEIKKKQKKNKISGLSKIGVYGEKKVVNQFIEILNDISGKILYQISEGYLEMKVEVDISEYDIFDNYMESYIYGSEEDVYPKNETIVLRIQNQIPAVYDSFPMGQVCLNDFKNTLDHKDTKFHSGYKIFRAMCVIHILEERLQTENYESVKLEDTDHKIYKESHKKAIEKEIEYLKEKLPSLSTKNIERTDNKDDDHDIYKEVYYKYGTIFEVKSTQKSGESKRVFAVNFF